MDPEKEAFLERLRATPEADVRYNVQHGGYASQHKRWAAQWVSERDQEARDAERALETSAATEANALKRAMATSAREAVDAARTQAEAAQEANRIAQRANIIATLALIAAIIAIAISVIALFATG